MTLFLHAIISLSGKAFRVLFCQSPFCFARILKRKAELRTAVRLLARFLSNVPLLNNIFINGNAIYANAVRIMLTITD